MKRFCLTLDLKEDPQLISEYEFWHRNVWPEIKLSIQNAGIIGMEIYRFDVRLVMIMETEDTFTFEKKAALDKANPKVQEWETLMWKFQESLPKSKKGEKWVLMKKIFSL